MNANQFGMITGIVFGIAIVILLMAKVFNRDGKLKTKYDERQLRARGEAYKYGMFASIITCAVLLVADFGTNNICSLGSMVFFIPILVGLVVQVSYSIFADAYVGMNTNMTKFIVVMAIVSAINIGTGVIAILQGEMFKDGKLGTPFSSFGVGILFIVVAIELIIKKAIDERGEREDA